MLPRFEQFISEKQYLLGVSPATVVWYKQSLRWLPIETPTDQDLKAIVMRMRAQGLKPSGCNSYIRAINSYLQWSKSGLKIPALKEPTMVLPVYSPVQLQKLINFKPKGFFERRQHLLLLILLDTGCRISEALGLHASEVDLDNLLLTLNGKGGKQRKVPISMELRKALFRFTREFCPATYMLVLATRHGLKSRPACCGAGHEAAFASNLASMHQPECYMRSVIRSRRTTSGRVGQFFICRKCWGTARWR